MGTGPNEQAEKPEFTHIKIQACWHTPRKERLQDRTDELGLKSESKQAEGRFLLQGPSGGLPAEGVAQNLAGTSDLK